MYKISFVSTIHLGALREQDSGVGWVDARKPNITEAFVGFRYRLTQPTNYELSLSFLIQIAHINIASFHLFEHFLFN